MCVLLVTFTVYIFIADNRLPRYFFLLVVIEYTTITMSLTSPFIFDILLHSFPLISASGIKNLRGFTVNVGKREGTSASLYAQNVADVEHLLTSLVSAQEQDPAASSEERPMTLIVESAVDLDM